MGSSYHQFCPVAKAMELLDERWTMLIVRELVTGSQHFNDLRRGVPRMSPTLLSKRLHQLVRAGIVDRFAFPDMPAKARHWWLLITPGQADVCDTDPGYPVMLTVTASLRHMVQLWRGDLSWPRALRSGAIQISGPQPLRQAMPHWFTLSAFAVVPRAAQH
jgi:DNA-binding HxlR family transcriptional regulator